MILYIHYADGDRNWYKIKDFEDLAPLFETFPMTRDIAMDCDTVKEAAEAIAEYLDGHAMSSWVEGEDLSKSLRNKAAALGLSLAAAISPPATSTQRPLVPASMHPTAQEVPAAKDQSFGTHPNDSFLWNISQIESSGGKNVNHRPIASGKFKGTRAIGKWGLLKPTIDEMVTRMRTSGTLTPEYQKLETMSRDQLEDHFKKNPQLELDLARSLASHVLKRQGGNKHRAAYSWLHGHNLHPADISNDKLFSSSYVNKYRQLDRLNPFNKKAPLRKVQQEIGNEDFKMRVKNWYKRREDEITAEPMRSSNFQPDPGRLRDDALDEIKPDSMKTPMERIQSNVKLTNKRQP